MTVAIGENPLENWLGFSSLEEDNERVYSITPTDEHIGNPLLRALHGGVVATFLEYAAYRELQYILDSGAPIEAVNINVDYLKSVKTRKLYATIRIAKLGRRLAVADVHAWQEDACVPVAKAACSFSISNGA